MGRRTVVISIMDVFYYVGIGERNIHIDSILPPKRQHDPIGQPIPSSTNNQSALTTFFPARASHAMTFCSIFLYGQEKFG